MIDGLRPYPAYRDSGVPWFGEVPGHWDVLPNRALFTEVKEREHPGEQMLSVTITKGVIRQRALLADSSKKDSSNQDKSAYKLVQPGDVAYNKMRAWQGAVGVSDYRGIVSPAYVVQRPREGADSRYFHYLLRTPAFAKEAERWSYGITSDMWSLRPEHFRMIYGCFPPLPEQAAIVRFLDHADRRIRRYIVAKQKLIALLNEQKQAIIHRAVTRGLDPNVRLKPSGIEWLGNVPAHWDVRRLKDCVTRFYAGGTPDSGNPSFYCEPGAGIPWLMIADLTRQRRVRGTSREITEIGRASRNLEVLPPGTILYSMYASLGAVSILEIEGAVNQAIIGMQFRETVVNPEYGLYFLESLRPYVLQLANSSTQANLNAEKVRALPIYVPSLSEQAGIVSFLDGATANIETAVERTRREISLTGEYRIRLIADIVTGRLDVREAAERLPDEPEEPEPLDDAEALAEDSDLGEADLDITDIEAEA